MQDTNLLGQTLPDEFTSGDYMTMFNKTRYRASVELTELCAQGYIKRSPIRRVCSDGNVRAVMGYVKVRANDAQPSKCTVRADEIASMPDREIENIAKNIIDHCVELLLGNDVETNIHRIMHEALALSRHLYSRHD